MPDPISAKGLQGMSNVAGELSKAGEAGKKGAPGKFEAVRAEKLGPQDKLQQMDKQLDQLQQTGKIDQSKETTMAQRVSAHGGVSYNPALDKVSGAQKVDPSHDVWKPAAQPTATGQGGQVAEGIKDFNAGQQRLDEIMKDLHSGKKYSKEELLSLQMEVSTLSEQAQMSTKLVDSAMSSIKSVMQQQV
jgi:hypothetical protein